MTLAPKILWSEGLTLGPQQFQQQDRYHETRLQRMAAALNLHAWGVRALQWDSDALAAQRLSASIMSLIFQDGEIVDAPPAPFDLGRLPPDQQVFTIHAALPALRDGGNLGPGARYARAALETGDLFCEAVGVELACLRSSVRLLSELEPRDACLSFPVARVRRLASGAFELDPAFMPPCLSLGAAPALPAMLDNLIVRLVLRIEALQALHRQSNRQSFEVHSGDISSFWLLHTASSASASLLHCARARHQHPEVLFEKLMTLAGALMTFSNKYTLHQLPAYRHDDPGPAFIELDAIIRDLLDIVIAARYTTIALSMDPQRRTHYRGQLEGAAAGPDTMLCLAVNADMAALELAAAVPLLFKVGAPESLERIVASALPGIELAHLAQVPSALPVRPNTCYFALLSKGVLYESMLKAQAIAIYVPASIKSLRLELLAVEP